MKRLHVHVSVDDLARSTQFYETLFGAPPTLAKPDYAKWMLEDPKVNFAISARGRRPGVDHVGIQTQTKQELAEIAARLNAAGAQTFDEVATSCCYAKSDKSWIADPSGLRWETFYTFGESTTYGGDAEGVASPQTPPEATPGAACCARP